MKIYHQVIWRKQKHMALSIAYRNDTPAVSYIWNRLPAQTRGRFTPEELLVVLEFEEQFYRGQNTSDKEKIDLDLMYAYVLLSAEHEGILIDADDLEDILQAESEYAYVNQRLGA